MCHERRGGLYQDIHRVRYGRRFFGGYRTFQKTHREKCKNQSGGRYPYKGRYGSFPHGRCGPHRRQRSDQGALRRIAALFPDKKTASLTMGLLSFCVLRPHIFSVKRLWAFPCSVGRRMPFLSVMYPSFKRERQICQVKVSGHFMWTERVERAFSRDSSLVPAWKRRCWRSVSRPKANRCFFADGKPPGYLWRERKSGK